MEEAVGFLADIDKRSLEPLNNLMNPAKIYIANASAAFRPLNDQLCKTTLFNKRDLYLVAGLVHQQLFFHTLLHSNIRPFPFLIMDGKPPFMPRQMTLPTHTTFPAPSPPERRINSETPDIRGRWASEAKTVLAS